MQGILEHVDAYSHEPRAQGHRLSDTDKSERLQSAYNAKNTQEIAELYDSWAEDYELKVQVFAYRVR